MSDKDTIENYQKELKAFGLEIPADESQPPVEEPKEEPKQEEESKKEEPQEPAKEPEEPKTEKPKSEEGSRKRSIYHDLKEKKQELRSERELREQAESERDALKAQLASLNASSSPQDRQDAVDSIEKFAEKTGADPEALKELKRFILQDVPKAPSVDENVLKGINEFQEWKKQNSVAIEKQMFEQEFSKTLPTVKELFPTASQEEIETIKKEVDKLAHTDAYHDKELDYVLFKNKGTLSQMISPKKRGMEPSKRSAPEASTESFDPTADPSQMSPKQRAQWMEDYNKATAQKQGIFTDGAGKKIII